MEKIIKGIRELFPLIIAAAIISSVTGLAIAGIIKLIILMF